MEPFLQWAIVSDNADPQGLNRVKINKKNENESVTEWIPVLAPFAGESTGFSMLPEKNSQVLVISMDGSDDHKAVIGGVWSNEALPPETGENTAADLNGNGENTLRFFKSRVGNQLIFDDTDKAELIQLIAAGGETRLELASKEKEETILLTTDKDITIGAKKNVIIMAEEVDITCKKQLNISTDKLQVAAKDDIDLNSDGDIGLSGSGVGVN